MGYKTLTTGSRVFLSSSFSISIIKFAGISQKVSSLIWLNHPNKKNKYGTDISNGSKVHWNRFFEL